MADVYFVNDTSSGLNWGSQASTLALRSMIENTGSRITNTIYKQQLRQYRPNPGLSWSDCLPRAIRKTVTHLAHRDLAKAHRSVTRWDDAVPETYDRFEIYTRRLLEHTDVFERELAAIRSADTVVLNGEGLMYDSSDRCTRALFFMAYLAAVEFDSRCIITNVTFEPRDSTIRNLARNVFPKVDEVIFREPVSARKYGHLCGGFRSAADPVFSCRASEDRGALIESFSDGRLDVRPYASNSFDPREPYITVAGNSIYADRSEFPTREYRTLCKQLDTIGPQVLLVISARSDERLLAPVAESENLSMIGLNISVRDSLDLLANAEAYVGGRYHPAIFSLKGNVPVVPLSPNTHKMAGLLELVGSNAEIFDPFRIGRDCGRIIEMTEQYVDDSSEFVDGPPNLEQLAELSHKNVACLAR